MKKSRDVVKIGPHINLLKINQFVSVIEHKRQTPDTILKTTSFWTQNRNQQQNRH